MSHNIQKIAALSCGPCVGLRQGMSTSSEPHEYLYRTTPRDVNGLTTYRCLLCRNSISVDLSRTVAKWF